MDTYGIWCGKDATVAVIDDFSIAFLRIKKDVIVSILKCSSYGTIGVVYGLGVNFDAHAIYCVKDPETSLEYSNSVVGDNSLEKHTQDLYFYPEPNKMTYIMFDGTEFSLELAEKINLEDFNREHPIDETLSLGKRMALWGMNKDFESREGNLTVDITTQKYSICYHLSLKEKHVYCRVGQNGYCEKGWAMLSTTCIRQNECRMIENNLLTLNEYLPDEKYFVENSCAFPPDGGWYWSINRVTTDVIYLNGCEGKSYEIHRKRG